MSCRSDDFACERWKDIPGFAGRYQASNEGRIRRVWEKSGKITVLRPYSKHCKGKAANSKTLRVHMALPDGRRVERTVLKLVAETFLRVPTGKVPVHKNGVHDDNHVSNISFMSELELGPKYGGLSSRKPVAKIDENGDIVEFYRSARAAAKENFLSYQTVIDRCNRKVKKEFALDGYSYRWDDDGRSK